MTTDIDFILIFQNPLKCSSVFMIRDFKLIKVKDIDFCLLENELVKDFVYIKELDKVIFITNTNTINSFVVNSGFRVKIPVDLQEEVCCHLNLDEEKKLVCLKTNHFLRVYTIHMQVVFTFKIDGYDFVCLKGKTDESRLLIRNVENLFELRIKVNSQENAENYENLDFFNFESCVHVLSKDFCDEAKKNLYWGFYSRKFIVPDNHPNFKALIIE